MGDGGDPPAGVPRAVQDHPVERGTPSAAMVPDEQGCEAVDVVEGGHHEPGVGAAADPGASAGAVHRGGVLPHGDEGGGREARGEGLRRGRAGGA